MKILATADDSGSLKEINCTRGTDTSKQTAPQPESIVNHCEGTRLTQIQKFITYKDKFIVAARLGGNVQFFDLQTYELLGEKGGLASTVTDNFVSLFLNNTDGLIYTCTESGKVSILDPEKLESKPETFNITGPVNAFTCDQETKNYFAYGGKENDLKVFELKSKKVKGAKKFEINYLFKAKNVPNNKLDLREPIWITNISFRKTENKGTDKESYKLITVTRYGQVRNYDSAQSRRPILSFKLSEKPLITLAALNDNEIICSDTHTATSKFDITTGRLLGKFTGAVGSIQAVNIFQNKLLTTGGLDRYVRVFDIDSRALIAKVFVGTQISSVLLLEDDPEAEPSKKEKKRSAAQVEGEEAEEAEEEEEESSDEEEMWAKLESKNDLAQKLSERLAERRKRKRV